MLLQWTTQQSEICERIRRSSSPLKILLKTKNEAHFLQRWIDHHAAIVGMENLIIFDNDSDDPDVLATLRRTAEHATVAQFTGFHNGLHRPAQYPDLYDAIRGTSEYFILLDTDEFVCWVNSSAEVFFGPAIVPEIKALPPADILAGIWLNNYGDREDRFTLFEDEAVTPSGLMSGKSAVHRSAALRGIYGHNFQLDGPDLSRVAPGALLLLHMKNLLPAQRMRVNVEKLRQYSVLSPTEGVEKALQMSWQEMRPGNPRQWIREIHMLAGRSPKGTARRDKLQSGQVRIRGGAPIEFFSEQQRGMFVDFLGRLGPRLKAGREYRQATAVKA
jgi:hypothetical protein